MYEAVGKIKQIYGIQTFPSGFAKREFVLTTTQSKYPQDLKFEVVKDKCALLDAFKPEQEVQVSFDIRGNEYNGKYYVNLSCWKIQGADSSGTSSQADASEPSPAELRDQDDYDDEIPF